MKNEELTKLIQTEPDPDKVIVALSQEVVLLRQQRSQLLDAVQEAKLQIEYLNNKFLPTGTSESVLNRLNIVLEKYEGL